MLNYQYLSNVTPTNNYNNSYYYYSGSSSSSSTYCYALGHCCVISCSLLQVTTHAQFVDYLAAKHPAIRRARLSKFEGRNIVLWYDPETDEEEGEGAGSCAPCE